ncbi:MAG: toll/interleukin-1 receptor domain-containing protein [Verrucomicrobiaceae bacterium]|nr:toll/interleukin-1 receptor domain-containing protein [Verrucomicrobiaceae bacterium]
MNPSYRWPNWLEYIGQREVIPIIGPELSQVHDEGAMVSLDHWLAKRLAAKYHAEWPSADGKGSLHSVVCDVLKRTGEPEAILYADLRDIVKEGGLTPPEWMRKLARIRDFDLFVTTTFDPLMEMALNEERYGGAPKTRVINNSLRKVGDLPEGGGIPMCTTLVHLMGQMSTPPYFAVTENDMLEFLCRLQNEATRPARLFDALRENHLLVLGGNFPTWVDRLILRIARSESLAKRKDAFMETLADGKALKDEDLKSFLNHFSKPTVIYPDGDGIAFIDELYERWSTANPLPSTSSTTPTTPAVRTSRHVFISYAHEDRAAARALKNALEQNCLDVWLDENELRGGDDFERKIGHQIDRCAAFIPLLSQTTESRKEGWFRREWDRAIKRLPAIDQTVPFLFPITIDGLTAGTARFVREEFKRKQWTACPGGVPPQEFIAQLHTALGEG